MLRCRKENAKVLFWRGSKSSPTSRDSRGSRTRSGCLSDVTPGQMGQQQHVTPGQMGHVTPGQMGQQHVTPGQMGQQQHVTPGQMGQLGHVTPEQMGQQHVTPGQMGQQHVTPGQMGQQQQLQGQPPGSKSDRVTRSALSKIPLGLKSCERMQNEFNIAEGQHCSSPRSHPTTHKIIRVKEVSGICNPLQKLEQISLTSKKSSAKADKNNKRFVGLSVNSAETSIAPSPTSKAGKLASAAQASHKVTEFFPIRRSERRSKAEILKASMEGIEARLLANDDIALDIEVAHIENKGRGVLPTRPFVKGEFVVEYAGDLLDIGMAKDLEAKYSLDTSKGCYMYYFKHKGRQYCIDATSESGRLGRLLNHSRLSPNCVTKVVMLGETPRLIVVARQDIDAGVELLYDYGDRSKDSLKAHPWLAL